MFFLVKLIQFVVDARDGFADGVHAAMKLFESLFFFNFGLQQGLCVLACFFRMCV